MLLDVRFQRTQPYSVRTRGKVYPILLSSYHPWVCISAFMGESMCVPEFLL